jgi:hypothetical protein
MPKEDNCRCVLWQLDPEKSSGTNYAVGVCDDNPHEAALMSEVALTVIGVVKARRDTRPAGNYGGEAAEISRGGGPGCGNSVCGVGGYRRRVAKRGR